MLALLLAPSAAQATDFPVTNTNNSGAGSLRAAITAANNNFGPDAVPINTTGTVTLGSALPAITDDVTITGPGAAQFTVSGADLHRPIDVEPPFRSLASPSRTAGATAPAARRPAASSTRAR